ncbi:MAG: hypothetical protein Greene041662_454 [Candidatus Peregrinibacteria bacterium Greene0416_62]|nr:MAG: hypothetical protein Greene041662_454 [Candidatus Peregrinibacteria bacterium Greene0416_62]TSC99108.1 MAG: hypothetical protein Greene101449_730 [Candidatus Peregrinibacteria bacterium Greene1014_49]
MSIKYALLLDIRFKRPASMPVGMTSCIAISSTFAGLDASASHVRLKTTDDRSEGQYETQERIMN